MNMNTQEAYWPQQNQEGKDRDECHQNNSDELVNFIGRLKSMIDG